MEALTPEIAAGLFRASGIPVICTRGERVAFANPAAQELLGRDPDLNEFGHRALKAHCDRLFAANAERLN